LSQRAAVRGLPRTFFAVNGLFFGVSLLAIALVPLTPLYVTKFDLSKLQAGSLYAASSLGTVVVSLPAGVLADRFGALFLTKLTAVLVCVAAIGHAIAPDFWTLLGARALFGFCFGLCWTVGVLALVQAVTPDARPVALGALVPVSWLANLAGPVLVGFAADHFGLATPLLLIAAVGAVAAAALLRLQPCEARITTTPRDKPSLHQTLRAISRDSFLSSGVILMILGGSVTTVLSLLAPLQLRADGLSPAEIGATFSVGSVVFIVASIVVTQRSAELARPWFGGIGCVVQGLALSLGVISGSSLAMVSLVVIRSFIWALPATITYSIGIAGASRMGLSQGPVIGMMNFVWGVAALVAPLLAGATAQTIGSRPVYALLVLLTTVLGAVFLTKPLARAVP
jgi:DHA1 family inner membrane transport protein